MKIKTLLFGAGQGAACFIDNTKNQREFVGFLDNDNAKVGNLAFDLPVYSPSLLGSIEYDEIVITTQWAMAVKSQLLQEFEVPEEKIVLPVKNQLKAELPFYSQNSLALGRRIIKGLNQLACELSIPLVVDFGTLLGLVRDKDIITWDDDIDFAAPQQYSTQVEALVLAFVKANQDIKWRIEKATDRNNLTTSILLKFSSDSVDLLVFTTSISFRVAQQGKSIHLPSMGMWYSPEQHFVTFDKLHWQGESIQVPADYQGYLEFQYGDWNKPKKDIKLTDYAHLQDVTFEEVRRAAIKSSVIEK